MAEVERPALPERERVIAAAWARDQSLEAVAVELGLSLQTVEQYLSRALQRYGGPDASDLLRRLTSDGLLEQRPSPIVEAPRPAHRKAGPLHLPLSPRELSTAQLYADGYTAAEIAAAAGISEQTAKSALVRVRLKYQNDGRQAGQKLQLRAVLVEDGLLDE